MIGKTQTSEPEASPMVSEGATRWKTDRLSAAPQENSLFAVVFHDDDVHTFRDYIETLQEVFGYSQPRAYQLTQELAHQGRAAVWHGPHADAHQKAERARTHQPRWRRGESVTAPRWIEEFVPPLMVTVVSTRSTAEMIDSKETNSP